MRDEAFEGRSVAMGASQVQRTVFGQRSLVGIAVVALTMSAVTVTPALAAGSGASWMKSQSAAPATGATGGGDGNGLAVAPNGRAIVAGWFEGTTYFPKSTSSDDSFALTSLGGDDVFVAEWNPADGVFTQVQRVGGVASANAYGVTMAGSQAVVTGIISTGTHYFPKAADDSIALTVAAGTDTFIAKWNPSTGYFTWAQAITGSPGAMLFPQSVASAGASSAPIVSGFAFNTDVYFPTSADDSISLTFENMGGFVGQMRSADDSYFSWAQAITSAGGSHYVLGDTAAADGTNAPVVTGSFKGSAQFPTGPGDDSITLADADDSESVFLAAMTGDDSYFAWAQEIRSAGASSSAQSGSVALMSNGTPVVTGQFEGTIYFPSSADDSIALTASGGSQAFIAATRSADDSYFAWALAVGGSQGAGSRSVSVTVDSTGQPVMYGDFTGTATFPTGTGSPIQLVGDDTTSVFAAGVKADGSGFSWAVDSTGSGKAISTVIAAGPSGTLFTTGFFSGSVTFDRALTARGTTSEVVDPQRNSFVAAIEIDSTPPTPPPPTPVYPASAPTGATAVAGDASAKVSWSAPASPGSFPVSSYQATASPGGRSCLTTAPALTCEVTGLANGTTYTFKVKALNGAGWSPESEPSNAVTPKAVDPPADKTITITGSRNGTRIVVTGSSTGIEPGSIVKPWVRFPGQTSYAEGTASITVREKGAFTWERRAGKKTFVFIQTADGKVKSNTVIIAAR